MDVSTSHPARAIYSNACADSVAVFDVVLPISIAAASIFAYSSSVAAAVADAEDMADSNSLPTLTLYAPIPAIAVPAAVIAAAVPLTAAAPTFPASPKPDKPL